MYKSYISWWKLWSYKHEKICQTNQLTFYIKVYRVSVSVVLSPTAQFGHATNRWRRCHATWLRYHVRLILIKKTPLWDRGLKSPLPTNNQCSLQCQTGRSNNIPHRLKPTRFLVSMRLIWLRNSTDGLPGALPNFRVIRKVLSPISPSGDFTTIPLTGYWNSLD